jgi:hypothetical protein
MGRELYWVTVVPKLELAAFALYLGYDWDEVTGDGDLRLATEQG